MGADLGAGARDGSAGERAGRGGVGGAQPEGRAPDGPPNKKPRDGSAGERAGRGGVAGAQPEGRAPDGPPNDKSVHSVRQHVRFGDIDGAGIVYYPRFFNFFHVAFEEFFGRVAGVRYEDVLYQERVGFPIVHVETDFSVPLRHGDTIDVAMTAVRIGRSSFTCRYRVLRDGVLCARADITSATVDLDTMKSIPLPERYREALSKVAEHD